MSSGRRPRPGRAQNNSILGEVSQTVSPVVAAEEPVPRVRRARILDLDWRSVAPNPLNPRTSLRGWVDVTKIDLSDFDDVAINGKIDSPSTVVTRAAYLAIHPETEAELDANYPGVDYVVVFGSKRRLACEKHDVPLQAVVNDEFATDQSRFHAAAMKENLGREDLDPLDEAEGIAEQVRLCGGVQAEAARILGYSAPFIKQRLDIGKLLPELKAELRAKRMTVEQARNLGALPQVEQLSAWEALKAPAAGINAVNAGEGPEGSAAAPDQARSDSKSSSPPGKGRPRTKVSLKLSEEPAPIADALTSNFDYDKLTAIVHLLTTGERAVSFPPDASGADIANLLRSRLSPGQLEALIPALTER